MHLGELAPFAEHFFRGSGYDLGADIAVDDLADPVDLLRRGGSFPGDERWIGGDPIHDAPFGGL